MYADHFLGIIKTWVSFYGYLFLPPKMIISNFDYRILCLPYHCSNHFRMLYRDMERRTGQMKDPGDDSIHKHTYTLTLMSYLNLYGMAYNGRLSVFRCFWRTRGNRGEELNEKERMRRRKTKLQS